MSQPCSNPSATTSTARSGTAVFRGAGLADGSLLADAVPLPDAVERTVDGTSPTESSPEHADRAAQESSARTASGAAGRGLMPQSHPRRSAVARS